MQVSKDWKFSGKGVPPKLPGTKIPRGWEGLNQKTFHGKGMDVFRNHIFLIVNGLNPGVISLSKVLNDMTPGFKPFTILPSLGRQSERLANNYISYASNSTTTVVHPPLQRSQPCSIWSSTEVSVEHTRGYPDCQSHLQTTDPSVD